MDPSYRGFTLGKMCERVGLSSKDLMDLFKALLLGIIEGLTEFIPVSSTGHLIITSSLLEFTDDRAKVFAIAIQFGAILAVCWAQREKLLAVSRGLFSDRTSQRFALNLLVAFMPAVVIGLLFHKTIKTYLFSPVTVAAALVVGQRHVQRRHLR